MRFLRWILYIAIILVTPFALVAIMIPLSIMRKVAKVDADWTPDNAVIYWAYFWSKVYSVPFELVLAILWNEGASVQHPARKVEADKLDSFIAEGDSIYPLGDLTIERGPAVGSGQVLRTNVERLWADADTYIRPLVVLADARLLALPGNERAAMWAMIQMLNETLRQSGNDLQEAARRYNGNNEAAYAYGEKAFATIERITT